MPRRRAPKVKTLRGVQPNAGIRADYERRMKALVAEMARSYEYWLPIAYRKNEPRMAMDEIPARAIERVLARMGRYWMKRFEDAAPKLARYFLTSVEKRSERVLRKILRDAGISVKFSLTPELRDIVAAGVTENVSLIKSIPQQYHTQVEGLVMRSVAAGRDLSELTTELRDRYGVTQRRAALIALDQNNKATSLINRERQLHAGIEQGVWKHSHAKKVPRPTHLANDGKPFNLAEGWFDPDPKVRKHIWPGELVRCGCFWKPVVKGFS